MRETKQENKDVDGAVELDSGLKYVASIVDRDDKEALLDDVDGMDNAPLLGEHPV